MRIRYQNGNKSHFTVNELLGISRSSKSCCLPVELLLCRWSVYLIWFGCFIFFSSCLSGGTCIDGINSYTCHCAAGYTGSNCQHRINPCDPKPCLNGATCTNRDTRYECHCPFGYTGPRCEVSGFYTYWLWYDMPKGKIRKMRKSEIAKKQLCDMILDVWHVY